MLSILYITNMTKKQNSLALTDNSRDYEKKASTSGSNFFIGKNFTKSKNRVLIVLCHYGKNDDINKLLKKIQPQIKSKLNKEVVALWGYITDYDENNQFKGLSDSQILYQKGLKKFRLACQNFIYANKPQFVYFIDKSFARELRKKVNGCKFKEFLEGEHIEYSLISRDGKNKERKNKELKNDTLLKIKNMLGELVSSLENFEQKIITSDNQGERFFKYKGDSHKKTKLISLKFLDELNNLKTFVGTDEEFSKDHSYDKLYQDLNLKKGIPTFYLDAYLMYKEAIDLSREMMQKIKKLFPPNEELIKLNRLLLLLSGAECYIALPMFFELLDSLKLNSDGNLECNVFKNKQSTIDYNNDFYERHKVHKYYDDEKIRSYEKRLNTFYHQLEIGGYSKDFLEIMEENIFCENEIKRIRIYRKSKHGLNHDEFKKIKPLVRIENQLRQSLKKIKKGTESEAAIKKEIKSISERRQKKYSEMTKIIKDEDEKYIIKRLWKHKNA